MMMAPRRKRTKMRTRRKKLLLWQGPLHQHRQRQLRKLKFSTPLRWVKKFQMQMQMQMKWWPQKWKWLRTSILLFSPLWILTLRGYWTRAVVRIREAVIIIAKWFSIQERMNREWYVLATRDSLWIPTTTDSVTVRSFIKLVVMSLWVLNVLFPVQTLMNVSSTMAAVSRPAKTFPAPLNAAAKRDYKSTQPQEILASVSFASEL